MLIPFVKSAPMTGPNLDIERYTPAPVVAKPATPVVSSLAPSAPMPRESTVAAPRVKISSVSPEINPLFLYAWNEEGDFIRVTLFAPSNVPSGLRYIQATVATTTSGGCFENPKPVDTLVINDSSCVRGTDKIKAVFEKLRHAQPVPSMRLGPGRVTITTAS